MTKAATADVEQSVAVVIVNYNGARYIESCLTALQKQSVQPDRILVIDNASTDQSANLVARQFPEVELVRLSENHGLTKAIKEKCHDLLVLPGEKSLNVAAAGSIAIYDRVAKMG